MEIGGDLQEKRDICVLPNNPDYLLKITLETFFPTCQRK